MQNVFIILGYGIPKNILDDENYNFYLKSVFNKIFTITAQEQSSKPLIITSGGPTDMYEPYKRTEAEEMIRLFNNIVEKKPYLKSISKNWQFIPEKSSLSTLENLLQSQKIVRKHKIEYGRFFIFCEQTREKRLKELVKKIFSRDRKYKVMPIDFDLSVNRYLPLEYLKKKEEAELKHSLWALKTPKNLKKHHAVFAEKIDYLRNAGPKAHADAVKEWWDQKLKELDQ